MSGSPAILQPAKPNECQFSMATVHEGDSTERIMAALEPDGPKYRRGIALCTEEH